MSNTAISVVRIRFRWTLDNDLAVGTNGSVGLSVRLEVFGSTTCGISRVSQDRGGGFRLWKGLSGDVDEAVVKLTSEGFEVEGIWMTLS